MPGRCRGGPQDDHPREEWTRVGGRTVFCRRWPGPPGNVQAPVVLVHGLGISGAYWRRVGTRLSKDFPVYAPDLPGHGWSAPAREFLSVRSRAEVLLHWMQEARLPPVILVGHSLGCQIVANAAVVQPSRVRGVVLASPTVDPGIRSPWRMLFWLAFTALLEPVLLDLLALYDYTRCGPRVLRREVRSMNEDFLEETLPQVTAPCIVVRGESDPLVTKAWARFVAARAGNAPLVETAGAHGIPWSSPQAFADIVRAFATGDLVCDGVVVTWRSRAATGACRPGAAWSGRE